MFSALHFYFLSEIILFWFILGYFVYGFFFSKDYENLLYLCYVIFIMGMQMYLISPIVGVIELCSGNFIVTGFQQNLKIILLCSAMIIIYASYILEGTKKQFFEISTLIYFSV